MCSTAIMYFDGGSRGNPGLSSGGAYITVDGQSHEASQLLKYGTVNEAEYTGLIAGLKWCVENSIQSVQIFGDSKLVVLQMKGRWGCHAQNLVSYLTLARDLISQIPEWTIKWIPRAQNVEADRICNKVMDQYKESLYPKNLLGLEDLMIQIPRADLEETFELWSKGFPDLIRFPGVSYKNCLLAQLDGQTPAESVKAEWARIHLAMVDGPDKFPGDFYQMPESA